MAFLRGPFVRRDRARARPTRAHGAPRLGARTRVAAAVDVDGTALMRRWDRVRTLFHECQDLESTARAAWLDAQCADDAALRAEVEGLLRAQANPARIFARD